MGNLSAEKTFILSVWTEVLMYGALVPLFWSSIFLEIHETVRSRINRPNASVALAMFSLATAHVGINLFRLIRGYVDDRNEPGGPAAFFQNLANPTHVAKDMIFTVQSLLGDGFNIYRCWIIWNYTYYVIAIPCLMLMTSIVCSAMVIKGFLEVDSAASVFSAQLDCWIKLFYSIELAQNVIITSLIACRLWRMDRQSDAYHTDRKWTLLPVALIVVESAVFYSVAQLILIVLYSLENNAQYIVLESITPTVGLVFTTIIVRVALERTARHVSSRPQLESGPNSLHMQPMVVSVTHHTQHEVINEPLAFQDRKHDIEDAVDDRLEGMEGACLDKPRSWCDRNSVELPVASRSISVMSTM